MALIDYYFYNGHRDSA